ncbi:MAG: DUF4382 domain-containing protein [Haloarculaceae archaeon]
MRRHLSVALVALLALAAGCTGAGPGAGSGGGATPTGQALDDGSAGDGATAGSAAADGATVSLYLSDQPMAIDEFSHVNVTVTSVGFHRVGDGGNGTDAADAAHDDHENGTAEAETETAHRENETEQGTGDRENESADAGQESEGHGNETAETETGEAQRRATNGTGDGDWVEREVDGRTVDLTRLRGDNATLLGNLSIPAGEYDTVFVHVSSVEGTLPDGTEVNVRLPSSRLHLNEGFDAGANETVSFVFDLTVVRAGNSGHYLLRPVIGESGPDRTIERAGDHSGGNEHAADGDDERGDATNETAGEDESGDDRGNDAGHGGDRNDTGQGGTEYGNGAGHGGDGTDAGQGGTDTAARTAVLAPAR